MVQILRPISNDVQTNMTNGYAEIDEVTASDSDFAYGATAASGVLACSLQTPGSTPGSGNGTMRFRLFQVNSSGTPTTGGSAATMNIHLYEGASLLTSYPSNPVQQSSGWTDYTWTNVDLSGVTNWAALRFRFESEGTGGSPGGRRGGAVSWMELEVPDAAGPVSGNAVLNTEPNETVNGDGAVQNNAVATPTEANETLSAAGTVADPAINATAVLTLEPNETVNGDATVLVAGTTNVTEANETSSGAGQVLIAGSAVVTEANETVNGDGVSVVDGVTNVTEPNETVNGDGSVDLTGTANVTEANETLSSTGVVGDVPISGDAVLNTEPNETLSSAGTILVAAVLSKPDPNETTSSAGTVDMLADAVLNVEPNEILSSTGYIIVAGITNTTEPNETTSPHTAAVLVDGTSAPTEPNETLTSAGVVVTAGAISASLDITEPNETLTATSVDLEAILLAASLRARSTAKNAQFYTSAASVTPSDSVDIAEVARGLWIGTAGTLKFSDLYGNEVTTSVPQGLFPIAVSRVWATGTSATGIVALF